MALNQSDIAILLQAAATHYLALVSEEAKQETKNPQYHGAASFKESINIVFSAHHELTRMALMDQRAAPQLK